MTLIPCVGATKIGQGAHCSNDFCLIINTDKHSSKYNIKAGQFFEAFLFSCHIYNVHFSINYIKRTRTLIIQSLGLPNLAPP